MGEKIVQVVKIIPETEKPFKLAKHNVYKGMDIAYQINEKQESGEKYYELIVENIRKTEGTYRDTITIFTDRSDKMPVLVKVKGDIKAAAPQEQTSGK